MDVSLALILYLLFRKDSLETIGDNKFYLIKLDVGVPGNKAWFAVKKKLLFARIIPYRKLDPMKKFA